MAITSLYFIYITLPWLYFTLLDSTLLRATMALLDPAQLYITLPWLYFTPLDSALLYHDSTLLYFTLHDYHQLL